MQSIASIPLRYFDYILLVYISGQDSLSPERMVTFPCFLFVLPPLNALMIENHVSSISFKPYEIFS